MEIKIETPATAGKTDICLIPLFAKQELPEYCRDLDSRISSLMQGSMDAGEFKGEANQTLLLATQDKIFARKILLIGLGNKDKFSARSWQLAIATALRTAQRAKATSVSLYLPDHIDKQISNLYEITIIAAYLGTYEFLEYKEKKQEQKLITSLTLLADAGSNAAAVIAKGKIIGESISLMRDLANHPSNHATPTMLAETAEKIAGEARLDCKIFNRSDLEGMNMHAYLSVSKGSHEPPKFIVLQHNKERKALPTVVLVGKGITFDTGGISLKPSKDMHAMKFDMSGGAAVLATMRAVGLLDLPLRVIGLVPATENMPGGMATKPGDIVKASNGKTIEILNTDAEGRLVMADTLVYGQKFKPDCFIDLATLTGACVIALGNEAAAVIGNDDKMIKQI
ncbi:MAG TPA: leucyl aminopeptidase, partial [bacterium]|nr:leucyl aminopeptidase [bacterium]